MEEHRVFGTSVCGFESHLAYKQLLALERDEAT